MSDVNDQLDELRKAARDGDAQAQAQLGTILAMGEGGVDQNLKEALLWLKKGAESGDLTAIFNLGIIFEQGLGQEPDLAEAALWFWYAAEKGDPGARMKLGTMLIKGQGFAPDSPVTQAIEAAADKGILYAQSFLAKLYLDGVGMEQSDTEAEKWFTLAAEQGDESAIFNIGEMIAEGRDVTIPEDTVAQWFYDLGLQFIAQGNLVRAFDCLVSIKRFDPDNFLAQRLDDEIETETQNQNMPQKH